MAMSAQNGGKTPSGPPPPENPELRAVMAALSAARGQHAAARLFRALAESLLLVPVRAASEQGAELAVVSEVHGRPALHAFTHLGAVEALLARETPTVAIQAPRLARTALSIADATLLIDPGSPVAGRLSRRDLELLRDRLAPGPEGLAVPLPGAGMRLFAAEWLTAELSRALRGAAAGIPSILALHAFEGAFAEGERHPLLGVELDPARAAGERRQALASLSQAARAQLPPDTTLDVAELTPAMLDQLDALGEPLWRRGGGG